jgi:hypothetical protein
MPYKSQLYSRHVAILFLAIVALFEQIQFIMFLIIILVSLKTAFPYSNVLLSHNRLKKHIGKSGLQIYLQDFPQRLRNSGSQQFDGTEHCLCYLCSFYMSPTSKIEYM